MNARNDVKRLFDLNLDPRLLLAEIQLRFAAWVDARVARWLARRVADIEAARRLFETDRKPARRLGVN